MATIRQKKAFKEVLNGSTISKAMVKAGYAEKTTATTTGKLTNTKGWKELMNQHLPDSALAKKHRELLNKKDRIVVGEKVVEFGPETMAVSKALDMAYKLKGRYVENEGASNNKTLIVVVAGETSQRYAIPSIAENSSS